MVGMACSPIVIVPLKLQLPESSSKSSSAVICSDRLLFSALATPVESTSAPSNKIPAITKTAFFLFVSFIFLFFFSSPKTFLSILRSVFHKRFGK
jgi:hypothetical protein